MALAIIPKDPYHQAQSLSRFWSVVFLDGDHYPSSPGEEAWIRLIGSEEALVEVSIAIGLQSWSPEAPRQQKALAHACKAASVLIELLGSDAAHTGPVLVAVLSMAVSERLVHNERAWNIHTEGLAHLILERRARGEDELPPQLCSFLILHVIDSINAVFHFPLAYRDIVMGAIRTYGSQPICRVADVVDGLIQLQEAIEEHRPSTHGCDTRVTEIEASWRRLLRQARTLRSEDDHFVKATTWAMELILHLSWRPLAPADLTHVASKLRECLCRLPTRPCLFMDLTSCQLMLGAVAAREGSEVRAWFVERLRRAVRILRSRGWARPQDILEQGFVYNRGLVARFRSLWIEFDS